MDQDIKQYLENYFNKHVNNLSKELSNVFKSSEKKGSFNTSRFLQILEKHLPQKYSYQETTELFDQYGNHTQSKDFVIYDQTKTLVLRLDSVFIDVYI